MADLPLPDRGQPLDVTYIYTMANTINKIAEIVNFSTNRNIIVDTKGVGKQQLKNTDFDQVYFMMGYNDISYQLVRHGNTEEVVEKYISKILSKCFANPSN